MKTITTLQQTKTEVLSQLSVDGDMMLKTQPIYRPPYQPNLVEVQSDIDH